MDACFILPKYLSLVGDLNFDLFIFNVLSLYYTEEGDGLNTIDFRQKILKRNNEIVTKNKVACFGYHNSQV